MDVDDVRQSDRHCAAEVMLMPVVIRSWLNNEIIGWTSPEWRNMGGSRDMHGYFHDAGARTFGKIYSNHGIPSSGPVIFRINVQVVSVRSMVR